MNMKPDIRSALYVDRHRPRPQFLWDTINCNYQFPLLCPHLKYYKLSNITSKFVALDSSNAVTRPGYTAKAKKSHLVTAKADVDSFHGPYAEGGVHTCVWVWPITWQREQCDGLTTHTAEPSVRRWVDICQGRLARTPTHAIARMRKPVLQFIPNNRRLLWEIKSVKMKVRAAAKTFIPSCQGRRLKKISRQ